MIKCVSLARNVSADHFSIEFTFYCVVNVSGFTLVSTKASTFELVILQPGFAKNRVHGIDQIGKPEGEFRSAVNDVIGRLDSLHH
jgi:hypothetical protein